jgi:hypothetical protein
MSLPPAPMAMGLATAVPVVINPIEQIFLTLNTNPYFIGLMMLLLNLGGRFIGMEISKEQEKVFMNPWVRRALIFTVLFVATRNVFVALIMTVFVLLLLSFLLNENSDLYLWGSPAPKKMEEGAPSSTNGGMTPEETEIFRRLNEKYQRMTGGQKKESKEDEESEEPTMEMIYGMNLNRLLK